MDDKSRNMDTLSSEKETSSPSRKGASAIFHSEDDVLVYEDFIRKSRQQATTSREREEQISNTKMDDVTPTTPSEFDDQTNQQITMNNQPQQTVAFDPEPFDSGISSHVPTDHEVPDRPDTAKSGASAVGGTFNDLLTMTSTDDNPTPLSIRERMLIFLDDPNSSKPAMYFSLFIALLVIVSTAAVMIESLPTFYRKRSAFWYYGEIVVMTIFTIEFIARCYAHSVSWVKFRKFITAFLTFVDLLAIIPYYVEMAVTKDSFGEFQKLTVFRLFRLFRLVRHLSYSDVLQMSYDAFLIAISKSRDALAAIAAFQALLIIIFSTLIYLVERGEWNEATRQFLDIDGMPSRFDSIPSTFWFVAQVITTVGLGDVYPKTVLGRLLSFPLMLFGLLIIALPSIVLGRNFSEAWHWLKTLPTGVRKRLHTVALPDPLPDTRKHITHPNNQSGPFNALTPNQQVEIYSMLRMISNDLKKRKPYVDKQ